MKVSVITVVKNDIRVKRAVESVVSQSWPDIEHIVLDGCSNDGTYETLLECKASDTILIHEKDSGIYNAINKGLRLATGDVVGFLNADDVFIDSEVVKRIVDRFLEQDKPDVVFGNVVFTDNTDTVVRKWSSGPYRSGRFQQSWTPAHPTFYTYRSNYLKYGAYREDFKIAADVELMYRFLEKGCLKTAYIPEVLVKMSIGGASTKNILATLTIFKEVRKGILENGGSFYAIPYLFFKFLKIREYLFH